jgi:hypothetical protein
MGEALMAEIHVLETERAKIQRTVIQTLEDALAQAREGDITAVSIAVVRPNGAVNCSRSETDDVGRLLGAMSLAQSRMHRDIEATLAKG